MSAHRRSLVTATAAGAVLCALWFVPSARATPDDSASTARSTASERIAAQRTAADRPAAPATSPSDNGFGSTPYVLGSLGLAGAGSALLIRHRRSSSGTRS